MTTIIAMLKTTTDKHPLVDKLKEAYDKLPDPKGRWFVGNEYLKEGAICYQPDQDTDPWEFRAICNEQDHEFTEEWQNIAAFICLAHELMPEIIEALDKEVKQS